MAQADVVVYLFDVQQTTVPELEAVKQDLDNRQLRYLLVGNKSDLASSEIRNHFDARSSIIFIAAKQNLHIEVLKERLVDMVLQGQLQTEDTVVTNARTTTHCRKY